MSFSVKEQLENDLFATLVGAKITEVGEGFAVAQMRVEEKHLNAGGVCQGGALFTLADLASAAVANSSGIITFSVNANMVFLRSAPLDALLTARAVEVFSHHKLPFIEVRITDEEGTLVAVMSGSSYRTGRQYE